MANRERQGEYDGGRWRRESGREGGQRWRQGQQQGQQEWRRGRASDEDSWGAGEEWRGSGYGDEFEWDEDESRGQRYAGYGQGGHGQQGRFGQQGGREGGYAGQLPRFGQSQQGGGYLGRSWGQRGYGDFRPQGGFGQQGFRNFAGVGPKGYRRSDERVLEEVSQALADHPEIDASEIEVICLEGEIVLKGTIENRNMKRLAEQTAEDVTGVRDVRNELRISSLGGESQQSSPSSGRASSASGARGSSRNPQ